MSKKTKARDMLIDNKLVKQISIDNKKGKSTKFKPLGEGLKAGMHIIESNNKESHFDIYQNEKEIGIDRTYKPKSAGIAIHLGGKKVEFSTLPPIITIDNKWDELSQLGRAYEYVNRVKFVKKK